MYFHFKTVSLFRFTVMRLNKKNPSFSTSPIMQAHTDGGTGVGDVALIENINNRKRRTVAVMMAAVDRGVGLLTEADFVCF